MYAPRFHPYAGSPWQGPLARGRGVSRPFAAPARPPVSAAPLRYRPVAHAALPTTAAPLSRPPALAAAAPHVLPKPTAASAVTVAPAATPADAPNPKAKLNEWMQKVGHQVPYVTLACEGGFSSTIVLPLEGAGEAATCTGFATTKKMAETRAADQAMQTLMNFGLLDVFKEPSKAKRAKSMPLASMPLPSQGQVPQPTTNGTPLAPLTPVGGTEDFASLKQSVYQHVVQHPGKRTTVYMMMCPAGERRKRVSAALYHLAQEGLIVKHVPTPHAKNMTPFWAPIGYEGPFGGSVSEEELGLGRTLPLTEVKMVCYDVLMADPGLTAHEVCNQLAALGQVWEVKVINAALYAMEKDGNVESTLEASSFGVSKRWKVK